MPRKAPVVARQSVASFNGPVTELRCHAAGFAPVGPIPFLAIGGIATGSIVAFVPAARALPGLAKVFSFGVSIFK